MTTIRVSAATLAAALIAQRKRVRVDAEFLLTKEKAFQELAAKYPHQVRGISHKYASPADDPFEQVDVEVTSLGIKRVLPRIDELVENRLTAIQSIVLDSIRESPQVVENIKLLLGSWMRSSEIVRVIGAGRALVAAALPANRLAHGGAAVSILNDLSPLPNSRFGGAVIAVSASGKTEAVLSIMRFAQQINKERRLLGQHPITVIGFSNIAATQFADLCTDGCFLGIRPERYTTGIQLRALGDLEEYAISELFDALVVAAGLEIGVNFRTGHEDLVAGMTGPWHQH